MGVRPDVWGPAYWATMKISCETWSPRKDNDTSLADFMTGIADVLPCQMPCAAQYRTVLEKYPPQEWLVASDGADQGGKARRVEWYQLVRGAVRRHEQPMTADRWFRKHGWQLMWGIGFVLLVILAGVVGALCCKRFHQKKVAVAS